MTFDEALDVMATAADLIDPTLAPLDTTLDIEGAVATFQEAARCANDAITALREALPYVDAYPATTYQEQETKEAVTRLASVVLAELDTSEGSNKG